jgi:hypothetical protein
MKESRIHKEKKRAKKDSVAASFFYQCTFLVRVLILVKRCMRVHGGNDDTDNQQCGTVKQQCLRSNGA